MSFSDPVLEQLPLHEQFLKPKRIFRPRLTYFHLLVAGQQLGLVVAHEMLLKHLVVHALQPPTPGHHASEHPILVLIVCLGLPLAAVEFLVPVDRPLSSSLRAPAHAA